jgi:hypothetical protein
LGTFNALGVSVPFSLAVHVHDVALVNCAERASEIIIAVPDAFC